MRRTHAPSPPLPRLLASPTLKLLGVGMLVLVLLIPVAMVRSLIHERESRYHSVVAEIGTLWGQRQIVGGPILSVPYRLWSEDNRGTQRSSLDVAHFLPEELHIRVHLEPERRHRGLFEAVVYRLEATLEGEIGPPSFEPWGVAPEDVLWEKARLTVGVSDSRGLTAAPGLRFGEDELELRPGRSVFARFPQGLEAAVPGLRTLESGSTVRFSTSLRLAGSEGVDFAPLGRGTQALLTAAWPDPSFGGAFLPTSRDVTPEGFRAEWQVSYFGTGLPSVWRDCEAGQLGIDGRLDRALFGASLLLPVDHYQKTERAVKYAVLFLALTFVAFLLFEIFRPVAVHPVQYLLVGSAQCLFYLLLLSLTEHVPFAAAYLAAGGAIVILITGYASAVLHGGGRAAALGGLLAVLYAYLFVLLQAQEYALLLGSLALFVLLTAVMILTRHIDWYDLAGRRTGAGSSLDAPEEKPSP